MEANQLLNRYFSDEYIHIYIYSMACGLNKYKKLCHLRGQPYRNGLMGVCNRTNHNNHILGQPHRARMEFLSVDCILVLFTCSA